MNFWETKTWKCHMYLKIWNVHGFRGLDKNRKYLKFEQYKTTFSVLQKLMRYMNAKYWDYNEQSPISMKIKALYHFWGRNNNTRNKILLGGETTRGGGGANGKVGETTRGRNDSGRKEKWAKRLGGERESGRNNPDSFRSHAYFRYRTNYR